MNSKQKNNATADKLRISGNEQYSKRDYFSALLKYNQGLCHAEPGSEQMGLIYANRSAVYFELKQFDLCLKNIQMVKTMKYPKSRMEKLNEREAKCNELMKTHEPTIDGDPFNFFKLSHPASKKNPGIADCIELRHNKKFGNHLITTKALKTGDVVAIEDPSFIRASSSSRLYRCSYCCKDVRLNLIPCPGCTKAMFCSVKCCLDASNEAHQFECSQSAPEGYLEVPMNMCLLLKYLNVFDGNVLELKKFVEENKKPVTVFDFDFSDQNDPMYKKNMMLVNISLRNASKLLKLINHQKDKTNNDAFFDHHPKLKELWRQHGNFLNDLLEKLYSPTNCLVSIAVWVSKPINLPAEAEFEKFLEQTDRHFGSIHKQSVGLALHPALLMANGSCDPNIELLPVGNKHVCIAIHPIPAGAQLFRRYGSEFYISGPAHVRQIVIERQYGYKCDCEACKRDWPTGARLPAVDPSFSHQISQSLSTQKQSKENIKEYVEYIEKNYQRHKPTMEVYISIFNNEFDHRNLAKPSFYP